MAGGRDVDGRRIFNRATNSERQPGSSIKPVGVYLEALDNGYTAGSAIDDVPFNLNGNPWPNNWYSGYKGITSLRYAVEQSINTSAVHTLNSLGVKKVIPYLEKNILKETRSLLKRKMQSIMMKTHQLLL